MELTQINLEITDDVGELIDIADHAQRVMDKVDETTNAYASFNSFPFLHAELEDDGLIHMTLSKDPEEPVTTLSPGDFNNMMIHLRDTYFPAVKGFAQGIRNEAVEKANTKIGSS